MSLVPKMSFFDGKLKEKSKQDYEQEVERRKQGDKRILFVDCKGERLKPPH